MERVIFCTLLIVTLLMAGSFTPGMAQSPPETTDARLVADITTGTRSLTVSQRQVIGDQIYFAADDGRTGMELYRTDGSAAGTVRLADLNPGPAGALPRAFAVFNGNLYFLADLDDAVYLFRTDNATGGLLQLARAAASVGYAADGFVAAGADGVFFHGYNPQTGAELWFSDGTPAGTRLVADLTAGAAGSTVRRITAAGARAFFSWAPADNQSAPALWVSDGTSAGTTPVAQQSPEAIAAVGERIVFTTGQREQGQTTFTAFELWASDGTPAGTTLVQRIDLPTVDAPQVGPTPSTIAVIDQLTPVGAQVVFRVNGFGTMPIGLWATTSGAPVRLVNQPVGSIDGFGATALVRTGESGLETPVTLYRTDGTAANTEQLLSEIGLAEPTMSGDTIYVRSRRDEADVILRRNAAGAWTELLRIAADPNGNSSTPTLLSALPERLLFLGYDPRHGNEWRRTTGAPGAAELVVDLNTTGIGSAPRLLTQAADQLFFVTERGSDPAQPATPVLWAVQGSQAEPRRLFDLGAKRTANRMVAVENRVFASVADETTEQGYLLVSDGTTGGTRLITVPARIDGLSEVQGRVYFAQGAELWVSDGTPAGTQVIAELEGLVIEGIVALPNRLLLSARDGARVALWASDGTTAGTQRIADLGQSAAPPAADVYAERAYVSTTHNGTVTVWRTDGTGAGTVTTTLPGATNGFVVGAFAGGAVLSVTNANNTYEAWVSDGTAAGTRKLTDVRYQVSDAVATADGVVFYAESAAGELWGSAGTAASTVRLAVAPEGSRFGGGQSIDGRALIALEQLHQVDLLASNGTPAGTRVIQSFERTEANNPPLQFGRGPEALYLGAPTREYGAELWAIADGAFLEAPILADAAPGTTVDLPITYVNNVYGSSGPTTNQSVTLTVTLDPVLVADEPATNTTTLTFALENIGYLDARTITVPISIPADAVIGTTYNIQITADGAVEVAPLERTIRAGRLLYLPLIR